MADGEVDVPSIIEEVKGLLCQDLQVVSYKWLARQYQINANLAKRVLASIADSLKDKVAATYLVSGWTKDTKQHVVKVVQGQSYQDVCQQLESITSKHVYSLCPGTPMDSEAVSQQDYLQSVELMRDALSGKANASLPCFKANLCSAIAYTPPLKAEPRLKDVPMKVEEEPQKLQRPSAGSEAKKGKEPTSGKASSFFAPSSGKGSAPAAAQAQSEAQPKATEASNAFKEEDQDRDGADETAEPPSGKGSNKGAAQKKQPKEAQPKAAKSTADGKGAKASAGSQKQQQAGKKGKKEQQQHEERGEEGVDGQGAEDGAGPSGPSRQTASHQRQETQQQQQPQPQQQYQGPRTKRQKVMHTYIDEKGEEVTEEVMQDVEMTEAEMAAEAAKAGPGSSKSSGAGPSSSKAAGGGSTKAGGASGAKSAGATASKGKGKPAAPANQKNIMSFFNKKP